MDQERSLEQLKQALQAHHQALEQLESALLEFEESTLLGGYSASPRRSAWRRATALDAAAVPEAWDEQGLSLPAPAQPEIPSVRLGRSIKVRREELEEYVEKPSSLGRRDSGLPIRT